ncbi:Endoribonuclease L-PSP-domain-containing protein [Cercophora samala]|uniref:Endoribonuclease L-PSP-domain-containing protein n=1 Tax=Cercophora samala TaxID=330535 RepID=A0AA39Z9Y0_9PEZI|nr:Endoribonuclease L-PSP-domain-containing protein [Cercophora samala]
MSTCSGAEVFKVNIETLDSHIRNCQSLAAARAAGLAMVVRRTERGERVHQKPNRQFHCQKNPPPQSMFAIAARRSFTVFSQLSPKRTLPRLIHNMSATPVYTDKAAPAQTPTTIYCSGQIPCDAQGNLVEGTIQEKTGACIANIKAVLEEAGSSIGNVVKVNVFLTDMANFASMNEEYAKWFTHKPARSCVAVKQLPKGVDVEIECIALP